LNRQLWDTFTQRALFTRCGSIQLPLGTNAHVTCFATSTANRRREIDGVVTVSMTGSVPAVAGAIAASVRKVGHAEVRSINSKASHLGIKAVVSAGEYLSKDGTISSGQVLAVNVARAAGEQVNMPTYAGNAAPTVMLMSARVLPRSNEVEVMNSLGANTNAGRAAGAIAEIIRSEGSVASIQALGAAAVFNALKSAAIAQTYLDDDGKGKKCYIIPYYQENASHTDGREAKLYNQETTSQVDGGVPKFNRQFWLKMFAVQT